MLVSEKPFEELKINDRVKSLGTGKLGRIIRLIPESPERPRARFDTVEIGWDDSDDYSSVFHHQADKIELI
jgi:hypothetical protein